MRKLEKCLTKFEGLLWKNLMNDDVNLRPVDGLASGKESQCSVSDCVS
jgi:hypothetical protein